MASCDVPTVDELYAENFNDIMMILQFKENDLTGDTFRKFENIVTNHISQICKSPHSWRLNSLGEDMDWLNTTRPLSLADDLVNRVLIIDFFTYCCINCIHILPILKQIEAEYINNPGVAVIGVHSPKFPNEKDIKRVSEAILQNKIEHPVINDPDHTLWQNFSVFCWPTVFIFGPSRHLLFTLVGESQIDKLPFLCHCIVKYFCNEKAKLNDEFLPVKPYEVPKEKNSLLFPAGISTNGIDILVSDTGHHRLLLLSQLGQVKDVIGCGIAGHRDGSFEKTSFNSPRGTSWVNASIVYVADTDNDAIRLVNLKKRLVSTIKVQKPSVETKTVIPDDPIKKSCNTIPNTALSSPWDICVGPKLGEDLQELSTIYVAVAGSHQIWSVELNVNGFPVGGCIPFAGSGIEGNRNNSYRYVATFAQPSGVTYSKLIPGYLYVADSESSSIRSICLKNGAVKTVIGGSSDPSDLFKFGDIDGVGTNVLLQHPLSICVISENSLIFTDSYNHKVKILDINTKECITIAGGGMEATGNSLDVKFCEPSALCMIVENKSCLICDTNNHELKVLDWQTRTVDVMPIVSKLSNQVCNIICYNRGAASHEKNFQHVVLKRYGEINLLFEIIGGKNLSINEEASQPYEIETKGLDPVKVICHYNKLFVKNIPSLHESSLTLKCENLASESSEGSVSIIVTLPLCDHSNNTCFTKKVSFEFEIKFIENGHNEAYVHLRCNLN